MAGISVLRDAGRSRLIQHASLELHSQGGDCLDRIGAVPAEVRWLADDFEKPKGLACSPDETILYVCDTARYHIRAFDVEAAGNFRAASGRVFAQVDPDQPGG